MKSPKLTSGEEGFYPYYAGFSTGFVTDLLTHLPIEEGSTVLDPWVGSGTTVEVASRLGDEGNWR